MRIEYINPFVESLSTVLHDMLGANPNRGEMYVKSTSTPILGVAAIIGLFGDLEGRVLYDMSEKTALAISSEMNMANMNIMDDDVKASLKELSSLITGQAIVSFNESGIHLQSGSPTIITGANMEISDPKVEALICSVEMKQGTIDINIAVREMRAGT